MRKYQILLIILGLLTAASVYTEHYGAALFLVVLCGLVLVARRFFDAVEGR